MVRLVTYPPVDFAFKTIALSLIRDGAGTPSELEAGLYDDYPMVRVVVGISDRGTLGPGQRADITVFDPARIIDTATFEKPRQYPTGVVHVIVGGQMVLDAGKPTGRRPGRILAGPATGRLGPSAEHHEAATHAPGTDTESP